ncbi:MAG: Nif3-like dinuclear metal center hexameric protein [Acidimicrobiia bacterium]
MPTVASLLVELATWAPGDKAAGWDPNGLQIGDGSAEVTNLAVCHEATDSVVAAAIDREVDLLVSYHPLLFKPSNRWLAGPGAPGRAYRLARAGVNLAIAHTSWDVATGGTADALAEALGLVDPIGFGPIDPAPRSKLVTFVPTDSVEAVSQALITSGAGRIGNYSGCSFRSEGIGTFLPEQGARPVLGQAGTFSQESEIRLEFVVDKPTEGQAIAALLATHPYDEPAFDLYEVRSNVGLIGRVGTLDPALSLSEMAAKVEAVLETSVRCSGEPTRTVRRVAVLPGSGGAFVGEAAAVADLLITGDLSYHQTREALDRNMSAIDPGHASTERPGVARLLTVARKMVPEVLDLTDDPTPWRLG